MTQRPAASEQTSGTVRGLRILAVCGVLTALAFLQDPGRILVDTKVDLAINPMQMLSNAQHLWNPALNFGELQNQAYGYLWPMGPFFALGDLIGLPAWVVQRLWWALLLCVAFTGVNTLAGRLNIGTPATRMIAAVAFALSPRILSELGTISIEAWPSALAPWVLVPLTRLKDGVRLRQPVMRSALVVACAGGVNATAVFAVIPLGLIWLATLSPVRRRLKAIGAWSVAVLLATTWWLAPLLILGRFSPPFLDYIETSAVTTRVTDVVTTLRGASHWLAYLSTEHGPQWPAGWRIATELGLVVATLIIAGLGLAGLARRGMPHRGFLIAGLLLGVAMVGFGHIGEIPGLFSEAQQEFLDAAGAPLRNLHKFDVLLRLPLALGLAHLLGVFFRVAAGAPRGWPAARLRAALVATLAVGGVVGTAAPALSDELKAPGSFSGVPGFWHEAADWVDQHAGDDRTLVVPAARFPKYLWGGPSDEITQPLLSSRWGVRNAIPLTQPTTIRLLDTIEGVFASGQGSAALADLLARSGIRYLLVRFDLDYGKSDSARPLLVRQALERTTGLTPVATFGPQVGGVHFPGVFLDDGLDVASPAIQVFKVDRDVRPVVAYDLRDVHSVVGGPEALLELAAADRLTGAPTILAGDLAGLTPDHVTITDTMRRREVAFGQARDNQSATMTADAPSRLDQPAPDYLPAWGIEQATVARYLGLESITASSSLGYALPQGGGRQEHQPYAAVDGDPDTSWRSSSERGPSGQWLQLRLDSPRVVDKVTVVLDRATEAIPITLTVIAGTEEVSALVDGDETTIEIPPASPTTNVRILVKEARIVRAPGGTVGISEVRLNGLSVERTLVTAPAPATAGPASVVLSAAASIPGCFFLEDRPRCSANVIRRSEDGEVIDRTVNLPASADYDVEAWARPRPGAALNELLDERVIAANQPGLRPAVSASSVDVTDPAGRAGAAMDGDPLTTWRAAAEDGGPWLRLTWPESREITGLKLALDADSSASGATSVTVIGDEGTRTGVIDDEGVIKFDKPLVTNEITILLAVELPFLSYDPYRGTQKIQPVGVSEVSLLDELDLVPVSQDQQISLPCGSGPTLRLGGKSLSTKVSATFRELHQLREVPVRVCEQTEPVALAGGDNRVIVSPSGLMVPAHVALDPTGHTATNPYATDLTIERWDATDRAVTVAESTSDQVIAVREATNPGWRATLGGVTLRPVILDGWQQGWIVPAGAGGTVVLTFTPDQPYRLALAGGAAAVLLVLLLAWWPQRKRPPAPLQRTSARAGLRTAAVIGSFGLVAISGAVGIGLLVSGYLIHLVMMRRTAVNRRLARAWRMSQNWLPPISFGFAGWLAVGEFDPHSAFGPQLAGLIALTALWLTTIDGRSSWLLGGAASEPAAQLHGRPLDQVEAERGEDEAHREHDDERGQVVAGEDLPPAWRVHGVQHDRMP